MLRGAGRRREIAGGRAEFAGMVDGLLDGFWSFGALVLVLVLVVSVVVSVVVVMVLVVDFTGFTGGRDTGG